MSLVILVLGGTSLHDTYTSFMWLTTAKAAGVSSMNKSQALCPRATVQWGRWINTGVNRWSSKL